MTEIQGGVALVTGAAGGIGAAVSQRLQTGGATVVTTDLPGGGAELDVDVTDLESVRAAIARARTTHGRLDIVVAAAGIGAGAGLAEEQDEETWRRAIDVNLWGAINTAGAAYAAFLEHGGGHLVLIGSLSGLLPTPLLVPYATAKSGVVGLATSLRPEAARHGIGVSVVCPGPVDTPMLDAGGTGAHQIDVRRYLTSAAGPAIPPGSVAAAVVRAIEKNRAVVAPGRAGPLWHAARFTPRVVERSIARAMRREVSR